MAAMIRNDKEAVSLFQEGNEREILSYLNTHEDIKRLYDEYLESFGDRCIDELKLESVSLHENPLPLLRAIGHFAGHDRTLGDNQAIEARFEAERRVVMSLQGKGLRGSVFKFILKYTRARVEDRENLRFERTRLFGRVRQIMVELGKRFVAFGILDHHSDIFYLEKDEILSYVEGFSSCPDLRGIAMVRYRHFEKYRALPSTADRFKTSGMVFVGNDFFSADENTVALELEEGVRQGLGCCPGVVKGKVRVVRDPRGVELPAGTILVAERTDPGWIMLFPAAAGLLVERGSLLSHSAIVARELGLPAVVSVPGITRWLKDGDEVEFDGSSGRVRRIHAPRND
jgi:pyruvate,water dikinase